MSPLAQELKKIAEEELPNKIASFIIADFWIWFGDAEWYGYNEVVSKFYEYLATIKKTT